MRAPILERDEEAELARRWRDDHDEDALHQLVTAYTRFVVRMAGRFRGYGLPYNDIVQEGNIGLMEAAARFEPERDVRFSTYASWWIRAAIQDYVLRNASIVRIATTASQKSLFFNLRRLRAEVAGARDGMMTDEERQTIADRLNVPLAAVARMESHLNQPDRSLNAPVGDESGDEFQDFLIDEDMRPDDLAESSIDGGIRRTWIDRALDNLSERERIVIDRRYLANEKSTLAEIGDEFGVTKERIRQIEAKALTKMRTVLDDSVDDTGDLLPS